MINYHQILDQSWSDRPL